MKSKCNYVLLGLAATILSGCTSAPVYHSVIRAQKPTINEEKPIRLHVTLGTRHEALFDRPDPENPDQLELIYADRTGDINFGLEYAYNSNYALSYEARGDGGRGSLKYKLPTETDGQFLHAAIVGVEYQQYDGELGFEIKDSGIIGDHNYDYDYERTAWGLDLAYVMGWQLHKHVLIYGGPFVQVTNTTGEVNYDYQGDSSIASQYSIDEEFDATTYGLTAAIAYEFSSGFGVGLEYVFYNIEIEDLSDNNNGAHLTVEYNF